MKRAQENAKEPQSRVAEIFLAVDNPAQDEEVRRFAERLSQADAAGSAVLRGRAAVLAVRERAGRRRYGLAAPRSAASELGKAVARLRPGELSAPIPYGGGYYLLLVLDRRLGGGELPASRKPSTTWSRSSFRCRRERTRRRCGRRIGEAEQRAHRRQGLSDAAEDRQGKGAAAVERGQDCGQAAYLPQMRNIVIDGLPIGQASQPIVQKNGVGVIMVCGKVDRRRRAGRRARRSPNR